MNYIRYLWLSMRGFRVNIALRIAAGTGRVAFGLLTVWLSKSFIDETIHTGTRDDIVSMVVLLVLTTVGTIALRLAYYYTTSSAMVQKSNTLRLNLFKTLFRYDLYNGRELHSGDISSRLSKDIENVATSAVDTLPQMMVTAIQLSGAFLLMRKFDARLAWALLLLTPAVIAVGKLIASKLRKMTLDIRESESKIQMQVQEGVEYNAVLRSLNSERWVTDRFDSRQGKLENEVLKRTRFTAYSRFAIGSAFGLGYLLAFVWGGLGLRDGSITFGMMTAFLQLVGQIQHPILTLIGLMPQLVHSTASIDRLNELEDNARKSAAQPEQAPQMQGTLGLSLENVNFGYAGSGREVIRDFSHDFAPGSKTAILGETGRGKTTLFRLLLGFVAPDKGRMLIYSKDEVRAISESTRVNFVYVPQGNTLMSGTIRYNLQLANPFATEEDMQDALHTACADFVSGLRGGLDFELGERGHGLSEGQSTRIAIARGLLRPGSIFLFDEISSSLDEATEAELYRRLFKACPDKTMIFVTHRTTICDMCDETVRL